MQELNHEMFSENKWPILKALAEKQQSQTELAAKTGTSLSNITQQIKLLEAYNVVKRHRDPEKSAGKPKTIYSLNTEIVYAIMLKNGKAEKKTFRIEGVISLVFNSLFLPNPDDTFYIIKFFIRHEEMLKKCKAIGFLKSGKDSIELFLITDNVDEIRIKFSNTFVEDTSGRTKKIINWTHNEFEINDGLHRKDKYFVDIFKNVQALYDPQGLIERFKHT